MAPLAAATAVTVVIAVAAIVSNAVPGSRPAGRPPAAHLVYVSFQKHEFSGALVRISTASGRPGKAVRIGTGGGVAFTPDGKTVYAEGPAGALIPISTATGTPGRRIPVPMPGYRSYNIMMNPDGKTAYLTFSWSAGSSFSGNVIPVSTATNTAGKRIRLFSGANAYVDGIVFSPDGKTAYAAAGSINGLPSALPWLSRAAIVPVSTATGTPGKPIRLSHGATAIAITPDGKTVYVLGGGGDGRPGYVTPVSTVTRTPGKPIRVGTGASEMVISPDGKTLYVAASGTITAISTATGTPGTPVRVGLGARDLTITPDGKTLYAVTDKRLNGGAIVPVSAATLTARPIPVAAADIAITPDGKILYATAVKGVIPISTATNTPGEPIRPAGYRGVPIVWIAP